MVGILRRSMRAAVKAVNKPLDASTHNRRMRNEAMKLAAILALVLLASPAVADPKATMNVQTYGWKNPADQLDHTVELKHTFTMDFDSMDECQAGLDKIKDRNRIKAECHEEGK